MTTQITNHVALALARLKEQFKGKTKYIALLEALVGPVQDVEDALWQLLTERWLSSAEGDQLDNLGTIVGLARLGLGDDDYRARLRAQIATVRSCGTVEELIHIADLVVGDVAATINLEQQYPAGIALRVMDVAIDDDLSDSVIHFLRAAKSAGVRIILEYWTSLEPFTFGTSTFLAGAHVATATTLTVDSTAGFPATGTVVIDTGAAVEETKAYTGITGTTFTGLSALANNHSDNAAVTLSDGEDTGFGDDGDATVGGDFAGAKE